MPNQKDEKFCDIVMKGGITSGIVYPTTVAKLAQHWSFKNIGGTSAGAIAAAATAAAQYGKNATGKDMFAELAKIPTDLEQTQNGETRLHGLFQPQAEIRKAYAVTLALLERGKWRAAPTLLRHYWLWALVGALPGLALLLLARSAESALWIYATLLGSLIALLGALGLAAWRMYQQTRRALPANGYGFCRGFAQGSATQLTNWLYALLNRLACLPASEPLTFGHLWGKDENTRNINLEMMTTNLTFGRPQRMPFEQGGYFYDPTEFARLFPAEVLRWMEQHSKPSETQPYLRTLPEARDLPVIVATRMSLSFPLLLSAVPLHIVDRSRDRSRRGKEEYIECCWFSDGGICSNFPVHFFDGVLPMRPSFAVNLKPFHEDYKDKPVYMPTSNRGGLLSGFNKITSTREFLASILGSMQNWNDNMQLPLPGYRDRIVHICLDEKTEGGLNLDMSPQTIREVAARGELAAQELIQRYAEKSEIETNWDNHRWVRFRSTLAQLETLLHEFRAAYESDESYAQMLHREDNAPPNSYRWKTDKQYRFAQNLIEELLELARKVSDPATPSLQDGAPNPMPELRVRPRL